MHEKTHSFYYHKISNWSRLVLSNIPIRLAEKGHRNTIAYYSENTGIGAGTHHRHRRLSLVWKINMKVIIESYEVS